MMGWQKWSWIASWPESIWGCLYLDIHFRLLSSKGLVKYELINPYAFHLQFNKSFTPSSPSAWICCFYLIGSSKKKYKPKEVSLYEEGTRQSKLSSVLSKEWDKTNFSDTTEKNVCCHKWSNNSKL